jgi:hypothetical protein
MWNVALSAGCLDTERRAAVEEQGDKSMPGTNSLSVNRPSKEPDILITSLGFADPPSLGFDLTVSRILIEGKVQYKFEVGGEY